MTRRVLSRRTLVSASIAALLLPRSPARAWQPDEADPATLRFRRIVVDASRVTRFGSAALAALIERQLGIDAARVFTDRLVPADSHAPQLVIRIDSLQLASYVGSRGPHRGSTDTDYLEGAGLVVAGGRVLSTTPILSALDASYSGAWYLPTIDERRVASISYHFASWLRRQMGL